jgi:hypothetical protein
MIVTERPFLLPKASVAFVVRAIADRSPVTLRNFASAFRGLYFCQLSGFYSSDTVLRICDREAVRAWRTSLRSRCAYLLSREVVDELFAGDRAFTKDARVQSAAALRIYHLRLGS